MVVGPTGEEIWTDKYGRVKVQFHWDREGKRDENSSCWIRVSQPWAGKRWGSVSIPRIGQEVLVAFLEGDPDQPIVAGRVYNGEQMPPYELPGFQTRSVIRTDTTKGGGKCNEIYFEDKAGQEEIYIHGSRDLNFEVENDRHESIKGERHLDVLKDKHQQIGQTSYSKVGQDDVAEVGKDVSRKIGGDLIVQVGGGHSEKTGTEIISRPA